MGPRNAPPPRSLFSRRLTTRCSLYNLLVMQVLSEELRESEHLDLTFATLADPTRRAILARLASGEASVKELAEPFEMSQPAISKHLKVLERAGLVSRGRDAQRRPVRMEAKPLAEVADYVERYRAFWEEGFSRLDVYLEELKAKAKEGADDSSR